MSLRRSVSFIWETRQASEEHYRTVVGGCPLSRTPFTIRGISNLHEEPPPHSRLEYLSPHPLREGNIEAL